MFTFQKSQHPIEFRFEFLLNSTYGDLNTKEDLLKLPWLVPYNPNITNPNPNVMTHNEP